MTKTLTITERQILSNQFRILDKLTEGDENFKEKAEILERGYTGKYHEIFLVCQDELPIEVCNETEEILQMYRIITNCIGTLKEDEKNEMDLSKLQFQGFDGNNDPHYHYAKFMIEKMHLWEEYNHVNLNSHSQAPMRKYRKMLAITNEQMTGDKYDLTKENLNELIEKI